jgi:prepilin-type N-terminal cleavage/methylation domain-containing protein
VNVRHTNRAWVKSKFSTPSSRSGLSLVEILVAMLVLGVLALAGGTLVNQGQLGMVSQKFKRAAIDAANNQMETVVWANPANPVGSNQSTTVTLNGVPGYAMTTTIVSAGTNWDNCYRITVAVEYIKNGDTVQLVTYRSK